MSAPIPGASRDRDRPRPRPAEQVRAAPRQRRLPGRHAVRHAGIEPAAAGRSTCRQGADKQIVWLTMPAAVGQFGARSTWPRPPAAAAMSATSRRSSIRPPACMSSRRSRSRIRASRFEIRKTPKPGFHCLKVARILEVRDKTIIFDETFAPPVLVSPGASGRRRLDRARHRLDRHQARDAGALRGRSELRRRPADLRLFHAADAQPRNQCSEAHAQSRSSCTRSSSTRNCCGFPASCGPSRRSGWRPNTPNTTRIRSETVFEPVLADIQRLLSLDIGRAIRLNLTELHAQRLSRRGAGPHAVPQRDLRHRGRGRQEPLTQIQQQFPALCKVGPNTKMKEIVQTHLPGIEIVHMPTPPAPDPRGLRSRLFLSRQVVAAVAGIQRGERHRPSFCRRLARPSARPVGDHGRPEMSGKDDPFGSGGKTVIIAQSGRRADGAIRSSRCRRSSPQPAPAASRYSSPSSTRRRRQAAARHAARPTERLGLRAPRPHECRPAAMPAGAGLPETRAGRRQQPARAHSARSRAQRLATRWSSPPPTRSPRPPRRCSSCSGGCACISSTCRPCR